MAGPCDLADPQGHHKGLAAGAGVEDEAGSLLQRQGLFPVGNPGPTCRSCHFPRPFNITSVSFFSGAAPSAPWPTFPPEEYNALAGPG